MGGVNWKAEVKAETGVWSHLEQKQSLNMERDECDRDGRSEKMSASKEKNVIIRDTNDLEWIESVPAHHHCLWQHQLVQQKQS